MQTLSDPEDGYNFMCFAFVHRYTDITATCPRDTVNLGKAIILLLLSLRRSW
jgi:hypothetical protein